MYEYETSILSGLSFYRYHESRLPLTRFQFYGLVLNWGFQGVLTTQVLYLVCVYEWVQTGLLTANLAVCSQAFFKPHPLIDLIGSFDNSSLWLCIFLMSAIISAAVQIFYAWRLYKLIGSPWVPGIIIMICLAQLSAGLASSANLKLLSRSLIETEYNDLIYDTATILQRLKRGFGTVNVILNRLITLVVETGGLTVPVCILPTVRNLKIRYKTIPAIRSYHILDQLGYIRTYLGSSLARSSPNCVGPSGTPAAP
ncbi:predicted protein [Postia placenta Mad-698-R]|nr:predicted protein [Postia placenta Mad-698-R]